MPNAAPFRSLVGNADSGNSSRSSWFVRPGPVRTAAHLVSRGIVSLAVPSLGILIATDALSRAEGSMAEHLFNRRWPYGVGASLAAVAWFHRARWLAALDRLFVGAQPSGGLSIVAIQSSSISTTGERSSQAPAEVQPGRLSGPFFVGCWLIEPELNRVSCERTSRHLEPRVMQVLMLLASKAPGVVSKEAIVSEVWPDAFVTEDSLRRAISELRRVLGDNPRQPQILETIAKRGYRIIAPVRFNGERDRAEPVSSSR